MPEVIIKTEVVKTDKLIVTQANALARAVQTMTLQEKRLLLLVMAWIRMDDTSFRTYRVPIKEICSLLNIKSKDAYTRLKTISRKLMSRVIEVEDGHGGWEMFQWVSKAAYIARGKPGNPLGTAFLEVRLHEDMMPLLLQLTKEFGTISFSQLASFRSYHSLRIFEILFHECLGFKRTTLNFTIDDLKRRLAIADKYPNFADFERRVLVPAELDCRERSPLQFTYEKHKTGRKVTSLTFTIAQNEEYQLELDFLPETIEVQTVRELTIPDGSTRADIETVAEQLREIEFFYDPYNTIQNHGLDLVRDTIALAKKKQSQAAPSAKPIGNLGGLVKTMLDNGTAKGATEKRKTNNQKTQIDQAVEELVEAFNQARAEHADRTWEQLDTPTKDHIHQIIRSEATPFITNQLEKNGWKGILYISARRRAMNKHGYLTYNGNLSNLEAFTQDNPDFQIHPHDLQTEILKQATKQTTHQLT